MPYKYGTPAWYHQQILETEAEMDRRAAQREADERLAAQIAYLTNPANAHIVNNDVWVRAIRATDPQRNQRGVPATTPRLGAAAQPGKLPPVIDQNQRFHSSHLKLKHATPRVDAVGDPHVHSPSAKRAAAPSPIRYGPNAPAIPPNGFWVL